MILVDTNVVSEPTKPAPSAAVIQWFTQQDINQLYIAATSLAEIHYGVESLPDGRLKSVLRTGTVELLEHFFGPRILPFDEAAALAYGSLIPRMAAKREKPSVADGQIAAIALVHDFTVATRDTKPFLAAGLKVLNPWLAQ